MTHSTFLSIQRIRAFFQCQRHCDTTVAGARPLTWIAFSVTFSFKIILARILSILASLSSPFASMPPCRETPRPSNRRSCHRTKQRSSLRSMFDDAQGLKVETTTLNMSTPDQLQATVQNDAPTSTTNICKEPFKPLEDSTRELALTLRRTKRALLLKAVEQPPAMSLLRARLLALASSQENISDAVPIDDENVTTSSSRTNGKNSSVCIFRAHGQLQTSRGATAL